MAAPAPSSATPPSASAPSPGVRQRVWKALPQGAQTVLLILACILATAAALAPMVYLLRRIGVG